MCKSTKGNQSASHSKLPDIQPNTVGGGNPGGGPGDGDPGGGGAPASKFILGDNVPQFTFISAVPLHDEDTVNTDRFLTSAVRFHTFNGLKPARFKSFVELVKKIKALNPSPSEITRLRIVTHAFTAGISTPLCDDDPGKYLDKDDLKEFLISNEKWMTKRFGDRHLLKKANNATAITVLKHIKNSGAHDAALTPFSFDINFNNVTDAVKNVVLASLNNQIIDGDMVKWMDDKDPPDSHTLSAVEKGLFKQAFAFIQAQNKKDALSPPNVNLAALDQLETAVRAFTLQNYLISLPSGIELSSDEFFLLTNAQKALNGNFRADLELIRAKFKATSWVDVRGCLLGNDPDFMSMISQFFGKTDNLPGVSGPKVFQAFPEIAWKVDTQAQLDTLLNNGETNAETGAVINFKTAIQPWMDAIEANDAYFNFWQNLFTGTATNLCLLKWKGQLPELKLKEGLQTGWAAFNFSQTITRLKEVCGISAGQEPTVASVTSMKSFVETKLATHVQSLSDTVTTGNMQQFFDDMKAFATELNANIADPVAPLNVDKVKDYRTLLNIFIDDNKLPKIKTLLTKAAAITNGANGKIQLLFHFGIPVVSFAKVDPSEEPDVRITHILALTPHRHKALRILLRSQWQEALPNPNSVASAMLDDADEHERHRQFAGLSDSGNEVKMTVCPMPKYMDNIVKSK